jgi:hypothetical protein
MKTMTKQEFRRFLARYNLPQERAGILLGTSKRSGQAYATGERAIPGPVAKLVRLIMTGKVTIKEVAETPP